MIFCYKIWLFIDIKDQNKVIWIFLLTSICSLDTYYYTIYYILMRTRNAYTRQS